MGKKAYRGFDPVKKLRLQIIQMGEFQDDSFQFLSSQKTSLKINANTD
jgi:hypothetical protein